MEYIESKLKKVILWVISQYQIWISPAILPRCRFYPSCSSYALLVLQQNSLMKALWLIIRRLSKCRPGGKFGIDMPNVGSKKGVKL